MSDAQASRAYPATFRVADGDVTLRFMAAGDADAIVALARGLPEHDLLFLRRDITDPAHVADWVREIEAGDITTILALRGADVVGYATIDRGGMPWTPHVGEIRILTSRAMRGTGLGRLLTQEAFLLALDQGIEKMVAQMTVDQAAAIAIFKGMGFKPEALLRDHVRDRTGRKHDLVILSHDVAAFQARLAALGAEHLAVDAS